MKNIHLVLLPLATAAFSTPSPSSFRSASLAWKRFVDKGLSSSSSSSSSQRYHCQLQPHNPWRRRHHSSITARSESTSGEGGAQMDKTKILGVCGGIGSGKSTACQLMVDSLGCVARIDADKLAHVVYEPGSKALEEIAAEFGKDILHDSEDGKIIDRKKLGAIVFSDAESMSKLEQIVWPHVRNKIEERIDEIKCENQSHDTTKSNNIIIVEAALLLETNWHDLLDGLWVIQSSPSVAIQRLKENRGLSEEDALVRIRAQETRRGIGGSGSGDDGDGISSKLQEEMDNGVVTAVVTNDGTLGDLEKELQRTLCDPESFKQ